MRGRRLLTGLSAAALAVVLAPAAHAKPSPYATAPFSVTTHSYAFGQAPMFMPDGRVVFGKDFKDGHGLQTHIVDRDGSNRKCLTCDREPRNGVPVPRPQGDWILYHSWEGQNIRIGSPGYGGMGSVLYAMRPDGSDKTRLTGLDEARGGGEGDDDYHAYFSPDGRKLVWTHLNWNFVTNDGDGKWDIRVADFAIGADGKPRLENERVVRPDNGHWYETHHWSPDGKGFLYTETWGYAMNTQLFECRLTADGCKTRQLTDTPSWNEQAIYTPDQKAVIYMSSKDSPGFFNTWAELSRDANLTTDLDYLLTLPIFYMAFLQPVAEETTDLYLIDLATGNERRLTFDGGDGWIVPEFTWDPPSKQLWFTQNRLPPGVRVALPFDPMREFQQAADMMRDDPPLPEAQHVIVGDVALPVEQRTRKIKFKLPPKKKATRQKRSRADR